MRIFSVIFLIIVVVAVSTAAYGRGGFMARGIIPNINIDHMYFPSRTRPQIPHEFWFKPDADREQIKQDYSECRGKGERSCMREKGYSLLTLGDGFWYKIGTTQQQIAQDYSECKNTKRKRSCMKEKGYTWLTADTIFFGRGFWYKAGNDIEQLKQDYSECRGKGEESCMMAKGYTWENILSFK